VSADRVFVAEHVIGTLKEWAESSHPLETGGVLVGVLQGDEPWITHVVEVVDPARTAVGFEIPKGMTPYAVEAAQKQDPRVGLIGMWHSHPANVGASPTDKATLNRNAKRRQRPEKVPAVMIVVRGTGEGWVLDVLRDTGQGAAPAEIVLTGAMSTEEVSDDAK
jgi:proteasome lid subunit RPN8/RPN11